MKNKYNKTHLIILFLISIYSVGINAQKKETIIPFDNKKQYYFFASTEVFLLDASLQFGLNIDNRFLIGLEGNFGLNSSNYIIVGGKHFATNRTLYTYEKRDEHGGERYIGFIGGSLFGRFFIFKSFPIDVGIQKEYFLHLDDSDDDPGDGEFNGAYVKFFYPSKLREKKGKYRRQPSVGVKISAGNFVENRY